LAKKQLNKPEIEAVVRAPEDFDFEPLRWAASRLLAENSLITISSLISTSFIRRDDKLTTTACIGRIGNKLVISYNGDFVYEHARKPIQFAGLLAHEIFHEILNHLDFSRFKGDPEIWSVAKDCIIQSTLSQMNKAPKKVSNSGEYKYTDQGWGIVGATNRPDPGFHITSLMENIYDLKGPEALLRPPSPLKRISRNETSGDAEVDILRKKIYPEEGTAIVNELDIYKFLSKKFPESSKKILVIGKHGEQGKGDSPAPIGYEKGAGTILNEEVILEICKEVSTSAGHSTTLSDKVVKVIKTKNKHFGAALDNALMESMKSKIVANLGGAPVQSRTVILPSQLSASDLLKLSGGVYPIFFTKKRPDKKRVKVNIYIDVSGSCSAYTHWLYGCVLDIERLAEPRCFLFSNKIVEVDMEKIKAGKVISTGGTDFDCIAEHSLLPENIEEVKKSIIFTDGYASMKPENRLNIEKANIEYIGVVFPLGYNDKTWEVVGLETFCKRIYKLPRIGG